MLLTSDNDARRWHRRQGRLDLTNVSLLSLGAASRRGHGIIFLTIDNYFRVTLGVPRSSSKLRKKIITKILRVQNKKRNPCP